MRESFFSTSFHFIVRIWRFEFLVLVFLCMINPLHAAEDTVKDITTNVTLNIEGKSAVQNTAEDIVERVPRMDIRLVEGGESIESLGEDYYFGVFVNSGSEQQEEMNNGADSTGKKVLDLSIDNSKPAGTWLIVKKLEVDGVPVGIEFDKGLAPLAGDNAEEFNPRSSDETIKSDERWLVAAQAGFERELEFANVFASGGLAMARGFDDISTGLNTSLPDNFDNVHLGWVVGLGAEVSLSQKAKDNPQGDKAWILRMEGAYVNLEGNNPNQVTGNNCDTDSSLSTCSYSMEDQKIIRFAIIRRF